jgi:hypothetical protein
VARFAILVDFKSAVVIDDKKGSHTLTNAQIGNRRWQGFWFQVGSTADAICFDIQDDDRGFLCHKNVR